MTRWRYAAATDIGLVRDTNQDAIHVDEGLALVADGMGGHAAGEIASLLTTKIVSEAFGDTPTVEGLSQAIQEANRAILADAKETPEHFGMGTTIVAVGLTSNGDDSTSPTLFNVGDSRAYQLRDGALRQLSDDHSVAEEWVRMGRLTAEEALTHPNRHQLTRALGVEDELLVDVVSIEAMVGDRILLCSDGLSNELSPESLARLASAPTPLDEAVQQLVEAARVAGGRDNISAVLIEFDEVTVAAVPVKKTFRTAPPALAGAPRAGAGRHVRRRRFTWRVWAGLAFVGAVLAGGVAVVHWYAYSSYYLAPDNGMVAVYQGLPNGVLWYKPVKFLDTTYPVSQLRASDQALLTATITEPTLATALRYAAYLHDEWQLTQPVMPTTTTTSKAKG